MDLSLIASGLLILATATPPPQTREYTREYTYRAGEADSKITARAIALEQVKRILLEEVGVYVRARFESEEWEKRDGKSAVSGGFARQQMTALTAGVTETKILEERWNGEQFFIRAQIVVDPEDVRKKIQDLLGQESMLAGLEVSRRQADEALKEVEQLKKEIKSARSDIERLNASRRIAEESKTLSASDWYERAHTAWMEGRHQDALALYTRAIESKPDFAAAVYYRGHQKYELKDFDGAIADYSRTIELRPDRGEVYFYRGMAKDALGNYRESISDYDRAIALTPGYAMAYEFRGFAKYRLRDYEAAIEDYTMAITLKPNAATMYWGRGLARRAAGQADAACEDLRKARSLEPELPAETLAPCD